MGRPIKYFQTDWSKEQVEQMLAEESFAYQNIELPYGLSTGGRDRSQTAAQIYADDLKGKSVLDIGSKFGYFCFEAVKRGASRVLGLDVDPESVRKARKLAECLGADCRFELFDIEKGLLDETFDYVICLNVLHHMKNPLAVLDKLIECCRDRLVLEMAGIGRHDRKKLGIGYLRSYFLKRSPVFYVEKSTTSGKRASQKFFITAPALENLLIYQRNMFARLDILASEHKNRYLAIAHKRRIERLIVIAGPTSSGKTTLLNLLLANDLPELADRLKIENGSDWQFISSSRLRRPTEPHIDKLFLHYDLLRPHRRSAKTHDRDEATDIFYLAESIDFITVWTPPPRLRRQLQQSEIDPNIKRGKFKGDSRHKKLLKDYKSDAFIISFYRQWFDFIKRFEADQWIVSLEDNVRFYSPDQWIKETEKYLNENVKVK